MKEKNIAYTLYVFLFVLQLFFFNWHINRGDKEFRIDFLLFRHEWMKSVNLGLRRLISIIINLCIFSEFILLVLATYEIHYKAGKGVDYFSTQP